MSDLSTLIKKLKKEYHLKTVELWPYRSDYYPVSDIVDHEDSSFDYVVGGIIFILDEKGNDIMELREPERVGHGLKRMKKEERDKAKYLLEPVDDRGFLSAIPWVNRRKQKRGI
jgi:hypothetical protein